ncbi:hypothetical protein BH20CHL8_BH20CHL8_09170 [soil metagenome]
MREWWSCPAASELARGRVGRVGALFPPPGTCFERVGRCYRWRRTTSRPAERQVAHRRHRLRADHHGRPRHRRVGQRLGHAGRVLRRLLHPARDVRRGRHPRSETSPTRARSTRATTTRTRSTSAPTTSTPTAPMRDPASSSSRPSRRTAPSSSSSRSCWWERPISRRWTTSSTRSRSSASCRPGAGALRQGPHRRGLVLLLPRVGNCFERCSAGRSLFSLCGKKPRAHER